MDGVDPGDFARLEARVTRLEEGFQGVQAVLGRLEPLIIRMDERMNHMVTKEDLARLEGSLRAELATKPSRDNMWAMAIALVGLVVAPIGLGAPGT